MNFTTSDILGSAGVLLLLVAFMMNLLKKWKQDGFAYTFLNTIGAAMTCASSWMINFIPFVVLEATWTIVSLVALINYFRRRPSTIQP
jgi:hypothetical protein